MWNEKKRRITSKTKIKPVCVLSEYDVWQNSRVILTVRPLWGFCKGKRTLKENLHITCLHEFQK
jgi:hypothetical protein